MQNYELKMSEIKLDDEMKARIKELMGYFAKVRDNGALDIFSQLFQTDYRILTFLQHHPGAHPSIIADDLNVTRPNVAANLRILEQKGYIERVIDPDNRRQVYVNMTEEGQKFLTLIDAQLSLLFVGWFQILGPEEIPHLFKILELSSDPSIITSDLKQFSFGNQ